MFRKRHITICKEGLCYLVVLSFIIGGAFLREINLMVIVAGMMIGPLLLNMRFVWVTLRRLTVQRKFPEGVCAGDQLVVELTALNKRRRVDSWAIEVNDQIRREGNGDDKPMEVTVLFPHVASSSSSDAAYRGRLARRGRYRFGPMRVSTRFPLGLVRRTVELDEIDQFVVCPRLGRLTENWHRLAQADRLGSQTSRRRHGMMEGEFHGLRDWRVGDSRRWIHWRTSARRNQLAVREFEQQQNQDLTLLLDLYLPGQATPEESDRVEQAVSFAATVVADLCRRGGSRLFVGAAGRSIEAIKGIASTALLKEIMEMLAVAEPDFEDRLPELLNRAFSEVKNGAKTVLVSTRPIELNDTERFAAVWDDPRKRSAVTKAIAIDAGSDELSRFFFME